MSEKMYPIPFKSLMNWVVNITPQKLHHQHKLADEERAHKQYQELLGDKHIKFLRA